LVVTTWLIDKSALVRLSNSADAAGWASRIDRELVRISTVTRLEVGYSARSIYNSDSPNAGYTERPRYQTC
jgi:predicted nucleic acid-binding protein